MLKQKEKIDKSTWLTTTGQRVRYYIGDLARTCEGAIITTFMTMFLLMQGIHPGKMAAITLFVKIIDSFDDVIFGFLIDRIKIKGSGKYLPWFRKTFWLFPLFTVLFFMMPMQLSETVKLIWFAVFYLLYDLSYTLVEVPMNSLAVSITDNLDERNAIIQNRSILNNGIIMFIGIIFYTLISEKVGLPIKNVVVGSSVIFLCGMLPMLTGIKEYNVGLKNVSAEEEHYTFKDMFDCVRTNKYMFILLLSTVITSCLATGANLANFVAYYHFGMNDASFHINDEQKKRTVELYKKTPFGLKNVTDTKSDKDGFAKIDSDSKYVCGSGGLYCTAEDYEHFAHMLLNKGLFKGKRILSEKAVELMQTEAPARHLEPSPGCVWGLGVQIRQNPQKGNLPVTEGTYGWSGAFGTHFFVSPKDNLECVFATNVSNIGGSSSKVSQKVEELVFNILK